jgi:hypothetical protein
MDLSPYKKTKCLSFTEKNELIFFKIFMELNKKYGATYMSYTFDKSNTVRFSFRTDSKWANIYNNEKINGKSIIELCPLDIASRKNDNIFIIWDLYNHKSQPKSHREIMGMREDIGLFHGLTLSTYFNSHHDAIAIATEENKTDLATNILLSDNGAALKDSLIACRRSIINQIKEPGHQN